MKWQLILAVLVLGLASSGFGAETWTDFRDQKLEATFVSYNTRSQAVSLKRESDGQLITVRLDELNEESRKRALAAWKKNLPSQTIQGQVQVRIPHHTATVFNPQGTRVEFVIYDWMKKTPLNDPQSGKLGLKWDDGTHGFQGSFDVKNVQLDPDQALLVRVIFRASFNKRDMKDHVLEKVVTNPRPNPAGVLDVGKLAFDIDPSAF